jgi:hypothetical protein
MCEAPTSRNIPLPVQREVRQRCGFGCVVCGLPLYEYEHLLGWANVHRHLPEEITLLCDQHHKEKTNGLLPIESVIESNGSPYNLRNCVSKPYDLHFNGDSAEVIIGGNRFTASNQGYGTVLVPLSVDDTPLIRFIIGDDHLLLNLVIFDEFNRPVLHIKDNQLWYCTDPWDIHLVGTKLTVKEARRKILIEIQFCPPNKIIIERGRFLRNGVEVLVRPTNILITNNATLLSGCDTENVPGGLVIGPHKNSLPGFMAFPNLSRYLWDRSEALRFEQENQEIVQKMMANNALQADCLKPPASDSL